MTVDVLAVIPARGGSKRIPNKNVNPVGGQPLIARTIEQAAAAKTIDRAIVSTEDPEIRAVAEEHGGDVPFTRPAELATDDATNPPVVEHALEWFEDRGETPSIVVMLQTTSPLRTTADIDSAVRKLRDRPDASSLVSVCRFDTPPYWALEVEDDLLHPHFEKDVLWADEVVRSQDLPPFYHPNGALFAARVGPFKRALNFYTDSTLCYEMPPERSIDIDTPFDLELVRCLLS
ncbi:MAG: acylneuraminate cytidylyltransferase family protein [Natronomonas sp.]|nr:acylneuraminate cytidylyltransferase family protein [Natronomonas sp.]